MPKKNSNIFGTFFDFFNGKNMKLANVIIEENYKQPGVLIYNSI